MLFELNTQGENILVLGNISLGFLQSLTGYITLVAQRHQISSDVAEKVSTGEFAWFNRTFQPRDLDGKSIVFDFTNDKHVLKGCHERDLLYYNSKSKLQPVKCSAVGKLNLSISSNGAAPLLEQSMVNYVSNLIPPFFQLAVSKMHQLSHHLEQSHESVSKSLFLEHIANTWYLNAISRLTDEQIEKLTYLYQTGIQEPTTDLLGKVNNEDIRIKSRTPSSHSLSSGTSQTATVRSDVDLELQNQKTVKVIPILYQQPLHHPIPTAIVDGSTSVSHVAYQLSDMSFLYPIFSEKFVGQSMIQWAKDKLTNSHGNVTKIVNQIADFHAGETVVGALSAGISTSVLLNSAAIGHFLPSMNSIVRCKKAPVFHVAAMSIDEQLQLESNHSDIYKSLSTEFTILSSSTVQEAHDMAIIAHLLSMKAHVPVIHFFDGVKVATQATSCSIISSTEINELKNITVNDKDDKYNVVADIFEKVSKVLKRTIQPFEYHGSADAKIVLVSMGAGSSAIKSAVELAQSNGQNVGFVHVRVFRPWCARQFLSHLPSTIKRVIVVDQEIDEKSVNNPFADDVDNSFYDKSWAFTVPNVFIASFAKGLHNINPSAVSHFINEHLHGKTPAEIKLTSIENNKSSSVIEAVFWDKVVDQSGQAVNHFAADIRKSQLGFIQIYTQDVSTVVEPLQISHIRFANHKIEENHLVDSAKVIMVNDLSTIQRVNFVATIREGGILFFNTSLSKTELLGAFQPEVRHELVRKKAQIYSLDANLIADNYTIFYGETKEYLGDILAAIFYKLALGEHQSKLILQAQFNRIELHHGDPNVVYTKKEAIFTALSQLKHFGQLNFASHQHTDLNTLPLPYFVQGTIPSKCMFDAASLEVNSNVTMRLAQKHLALLPAIFPATYNVSHKLRPDIEDAYSVRVSENIRLTPSAYDRNVFHMELDITGTGLKYDIGDALAVYSQNDSRAVSDFLLMYGVDASQIVFVDRPDKNGKPESEVRTVEQLFFHSIDIFGKPGKKFYQYLAVKATDDSQKEEIASLLADSDKFEQYVNEYTPTFADLLKKYTSARPSIQELLQIIPPIKPRHYSIASSQKMHPNSVHLLIVVVDWVSKDGVQRYGQATRYLVNATIGDYLTVSVKPSVMKLPPSIEAPVIMSGLGTGMAPFRAFIEERWYWKQQGRNVGPMVLYFGSRNRANEYLYGEELDAYNTEGILTYLRLAFSRDQKEKVYIQHKIQEDEKLLHKLIVQEKGSFYLCGPTWPVPDVTSALLGAFSHSMNPKKAEEFLETLKNDERFILEVY